MFATPNAGESKTLCPREVLLKETMPVPFPVNNPLHLLQDTLLELTLHLLALLIRGRLAVEGEQSTELELGLLQQLNLADVDLKKFSQHPEYW